jgi:hypothetical protein
LRQRLQRNRGQRLEVDGAAGLGGFARGGEDLHDDHVGIERREIAFGLSLPRMTAAR